MIQDMSGEFVTDSSVAKRWIAAYQLEHDVFWDPELKWADLSAYDRWFANRSGGLVGFPYFFYVHTAYNRVWDMFAGFPDGPNFQTFIDEENKILDYCAVQSGVRPE